MNRGASSVGVSFAAVAARCRRATADGLLRGPALTACLAEFRRRTGRKARGCVCIDGLNFYYQAPLNGTRLKWLDAEKWARSMMPPDCEIVAVHYFTALVRGLDDPSAPIRQEKYLRALEDRPAPGVLRVWRGAFIQEEKRGRPVGRFWEEDFCRRTALQLRRLWARIARRPPPATRKAGISMPVEKGTDVNLAAQMTADAAVADYCDFVALVATDSDYVGACRIVRRDFKKGVLLVVRPDLDQRARPGRGKNRGKNIGVDALKNCADGVVHIRPAQLKNAQLPEKFTGASGAPHEKPREWR